MKLKSVTFISLASLAFASCESTAQLSSKISIPKEGLMNFTELSNECGFEAEEYDVVTEDGYILTLFRIPGKGKPILLVHGIGDTSNTWILRGNKSIGIALSRKGYDVWAGNIRGNRYGRRHIHLNPDTDDNFWDFSFHQVGFYDWPAMIDKVLNETKETKLCAMAHSQGTTSFFVLSSLRSEYNEKVELIIAVAPVTFLDHTGPYLAALAAAGPFLLPALKMVNINEMLADRNAEKELIKFICAQGILAQLICSVISLGLIAGLNPVGIEPEFVSIIFAQYPAGTSRQALEHYDQMFLTKKFAQYDYGPSRNQLVYGRITPPEYDLGKVSVKTAIIYSENDQIAAADDVQHLAKLLPNLVYNKRIDNKKWNHVDFTWNKDADKYFFGHVFKLLNEINW